MNKFMESAGKNIRWFENSGVMRPADGFWGVAERLVALDIEESIRQEIVEKFASRTMLQDSFAVESRRPDCNFEAALMFLLYGRLAGDEKRFDTGKNILDYLYFRSAMKRSEKHKLPCAWRWSHVVLSADGHWFDDNSWCIILQCALHHAFKELDERYQAGEAALNLSGHLNAAVARITALEPDEKGEMTDPDKIWTGNLRLPHWGALSIFALSCIHALYGRPEYLPAIRKYLQRLKAELSGFSTSEYAYAMMGAVAAAEAFNDETAREVAVLSRDLLLQAADPETGTLPSSHYEAPSGKGLADLIYTLNWSLLGLQMYCKFAPEDKEAGALLDKQLALVMEIQDDSPSPEFNGCWRGMYDMAEHTWGGGNLYEGGSSSIYSGWTNAPVSTALLLEYAGISLLELSGIKKFSGFSAMNS
ncbi:MAG: hypothetical protein IKC94_02865 [Lentisphaeria bacterium]|nr:hypothetical protein [Lentisphaeria bacterium]